MGLDASSTTIGLCLLSYNENPLKPALMKLEHVEFFKPPKKGNIFERLSKTRAFIYDRIVKLKPDCVAIEDIVLFMNNKSTAKTIVTLAVLNRTVGLSVFDKINSPPYLYNAMRIRHAIKKDGYLPTKEDIPELVADILGIKFPYVKNKKGNKAIENEDMADSIACAICHVYMDRLGKADLYTKKKRCKRKNKKRCKRNKKK